MHKVSFYSEASPGDADIEEIEYEYEEYTTGFTS